MTGDSDYLIRAALTDIAALERFQHRTAVRETVEVRRG